MTLAVAVISFSIHPSVCMAAAVFAVLCEVAWAPPLPGHEARLVCHDKLLQEAVKKILTVVEQPEATDLSLILFLSSRYSPTNVSFTLQSCDARDERTRGRELCQLGAKSRFKFGCVT